MTEKEKLHQILSSLWKNDDSVGKAYYNQALQDVQTAIDLQEEHVSEDLEEAAYHNCVDRLSKESIEDFKAGANWQREKDSILPKVWNRENLDEFSYQTAYDLSNDWMRETPTWDDVEIACKLGAKWQKEHLMKNAVDGEIGCWNIRDLAFNDGFALHCRIR